MGDILGSMLEGCLPTDILMVPGCKMAKQIEQTHGFEADREPSDTSRCCDWCHLELDALTLQGTMEGTSRLCNTIPWMF